MNLFCEKHNGIDVVIYYYCYYFAGFCESAIIPTKFIKKKLPHMEEPNNSIIVIFVFSKKR